MTKSCKTCRHFGEPLYDRDTGEDELGTCRINPPRVSDVVIQLLNRGNNQTIWQATIFPTVEESDWCSHHETVKQWRVYDSPVAGVSRLIGEYATQELAEQAITLDMQSSRYPEFCSRDSYTINAINDA